MVGSIRVAQVIELHHTIFYVVLIWCLHSVAMIWILAEP